MFIARQPIFDRFMEVFGYELLYRNNKKATFFEGASATHATASVLGELFESGLSDITDCKKAFINFDYDFLLSDSIELIDPDDLIIEVLEDVKIDQILMERVLELKKQGYKIALDDFVEDYESYPIVPYADIIKYDLMATPLDAIRGEVERALSQNKLLLAEKVETKEEFRKAKEMGFQLFQGYFFKRPKIVGKSNNKKSIKSNYLRILSELNKNEPSYDKIAEVIEADVNLAYRLLRITKSNKSKDLFESIRQPLVYMGLKEIQRWINILMVQDLWTDKPLELTNLSLIRSRFGASLTKHSKLKSKYKEASTMLLFSTLPSLLDLPMEEALDGIMLTDEITKALIDGQGALVPILDLVLEHEKGNWGKVAELLTILEIEEEQMYKNYIEAIEYTKEITSRM